MERGRKIILLCHCILNCNSKVEGLSTFKSMIKNLVDILHSEDVGVIQLPCPEMHVYGIKRWGHVKDQFDTPFFREQCRIILEPTVNQVKNYMDNGYDVLGVVGIDGSPSCGVNLTYRGNFGGEFSCIENYKECIDTLKMVNEEGVFIEELKSILNEKGLDIPFVALLEDDMVRSIEDIKNKLFK
ncbi:CD3072 family TudS-related putative desulfidase [Clostridium cylindrosporum]|uniref:Uncharacterized protein n=1 Tax=Clostridium cylindrosporum DSM 605 TaxID=1121307 RepID=A0A0J8D8P4_CLOCY|nr:CD3072 family TudS-related putative desulfidase [Clostridium cylindrosporum]KMT22252.1 hypothetical protein CLCY_4c02250 [Clostridium cylindrosporum DSM 605]